jgi:hypothetical protein
VGEWIPIGKGLDRKRETLAIARSLAVPTVQVVGMLVLFWAWADSESADGLIEGLTLEEVDQIVGGEGFAAALVRVGWLEQGTRGLRIPNWDRWLGRSAKRRAKDAARQRVRRLDAVG